MEKVIFRVLRGLGQVAVHRRVRPFDIAEFEGFDDLGVLLGRVALDPDHA